MGEEFADLHPKRAGESHEVKRGAVPYTTLDATHVASRDARSVGEGFLGQALLLTHASDATSDLLEGRMLGGLTDGTGHAQNAGSLRPFGPRPMGYNVRARSRSPSLPAGSAAWACRRALDPVAGPDRQLADEPFPKYQERSMG